MVVRDSGSYSELLAQFCGKVVEVMSERASYSTEPLDWEVRESRTIRSAPATREAIARAEVRLGVTLSNDYKSFLAVSNGLIVPSLESHPARLLAVEDIAKFRDIDECAFRSWIELYKDENAREVAPLSVMPEGLDTFEDEFPGLVPPFLNSIAISESVNSGVVLLSDFSEFGAGTFEVWEIGPWTGCVRYRTLWHYLKSTFEGFLDRD